MLNDYKVQIVLIDSEITSGELAKWVRKVAPAQYTLIEAMAIARDLINGKVWEPPYGAVAYQLQNLKNQPWTYTITTPPNPMREAYEERRRVYEEGQELARRGAEGDAEAAIAFCGLFLTGAMENWAMG